MPRVSAGHKRELEMGKFLVNSDNIALLHCIGGGKGNIIWSECGFNGFIVLLRGIWSSIQGQNKALQDGSGYKNTERSVLTNSVSFGPPINSANYLFFLMVLIYR